MIKIRDNTVASDAIFADLSDTFNRNVLNCIARLIAYGFQ